MQQPYSVLFWLSASAVLYAPRYESCFLMVKTNLAGSRAKKVAMNSNRRRTSAQRTSPLTDSSSPRGQVHRPHVYCVFIEKLKQKKILHFNMSCVKYSIILLRSEDRMLKVYIHFCHIYVCMN